MQDRGGMVLVPDGDEEQSLGLQTKDVLVREWCSLKGCWNVMRWLEVQPRFPPRLSGWIWWAGLFLGLKS